MLANSKEKEQTRQERELAALEAYSIKLEERSSAGRILVRKVQRLDVDGVLARSLPQTISQLSSGKPGIEAEKRSVGLKTAA
jgi:hypothetical protein